MKSLISATLFVTALLASGIISARAQGTAFTYQGRLRDNTIPAAGVFDLRFGLYDANGFQVGSIVTAEDVAVSNGLFCVILDFGVNAFNGGERWLETSLRPGDGPEETSYTVLTPRRRLTATPYALYAPNAGTAAMAMSVPADGVTGIIPLVRLPGEVVINNETGITLSGTFSGNGAGLTGLNATQLTSGTVPDGRLSDNVAFLNGNQVFSGSNYFGGDSLFAGVARMTNAQNLVVGIHAGDGASLSNLTASSLLGIAPRSAEFTGLLAGDVTGTQGSTVVAKVGGITAANVASGANAANGATAVSTPDTLVRRDDTGGFAAGTISATFAGPGSALTALNASQLANGTVPDARLSANVALLNHDQVFGGSNQFTGVARMTNPDNLVVGTHAGDGASLSNLTATYLIGTAPRAADFTGTLAGDVTGTQHSTLVTKVGGITAAEVASGANTANDATVVSTPSTLVKRDATGGFAAGTITATFSGSGSGLTALNASQLTSGTVPDSRLSAVANTAIGAANAATSAATPNTLVKRDAEGGFAANVAGTFAGDGSQLTNIRASSIVGVVGGGGELSLPPGITVVSMLPNDANLVANGYALMMTVPAPPWATSLAAGSASGRFGHSAVWDGKRLIVWGGRPVLGTVYLNTGASYLAETGQWEPVSMVDPPTARWGHTAVWSGSEMLVWGGNAETGRLNTGGRFQPDAQVWRPISVADAPGARTDHIAVWTGAQMFVWGGRDASGLLSDGGFYAPNTDQWLGVSVVNAPAARIGATAVWATDRVLIWGGEGESGMLNNGSQLRFDTASPYWHAMTSQNAPSPRCGHSAIWTGARMIVWGGQRNGVPCGDGAAYDPATDSWEPLPATGCPTARFNHAAVWTGQEMLVLGGSNGAGELATGAAYNPLTGVWRSLSSSGGPLPRTEATAVWAGAEVLVFGGRSEGKAVAPLQRLVPQPVWYFYRKL